MGIISACQISCCWLPANVSVIGKSGPAACPSRRGRRTSSRGWRSEVTPCWVLSSDNRSINAAVKRLLHDGNFQREFAKYLLGKLYLCVCRQMKTAHLEVK